MIHIRNENEILAKAFRNIGFKLLKSQTIKGSKYNTLSMSVQSFYSWSNELLW